MTSISEETLEKLRQYDTPTICNVVELFEVRPRNVGYTDRTIKAAFPDFPPMVGFASTATHRSYVQRADQDAYATLADQIARFDELSGSAIVVLQDLDGAQASANFGEVMCSTYQAFGSVGLVTDGPGRDLDQVRALNFPVFSDGVVCSHGYNHILDVHVPVLVGGMTVYPNDLLHGDLNGVTVIPREIASEVADVCVDFIAAEMVQIDLMTKGTPTLAELRDVMAEKSRLIDELKRRVQKT